MRKTWIQKLEDHEGFPKVLILKKGFPCYNAVEEARARRDRSGLATVPYWRTLKAAGFLNEKFPGGLEAHKRRLILEGHKVVSRGKKCQVADWEKHLWSL